MDRGAWWATVMGSQTVRHDCTAYTHRRKHSLPEDDDGFSWDDLASNMCGHPHAQICSLVDAEFEW